MKFKSIVVAIVLILMTGCISLPSQKKDWKMAPGEIVMEDGKILLQDFDVTTIRKFLDYTNYNGVVKDFHIILNTGGGQAYNAVTMLNRIRFLQSKGAHITTEIIGYGMSAGTFVFAAGDTRIVHEGATLMIHGAAMTQGYERFDVKDACNDKEKMPMCDSLTLLDEQFKRVLREGSIMTDEEIENWMYHEDFNFMSAVEAYEVGLATHIL